MNKKILMLLVILTVSVSVIVGCSKVTGQEDSETSVNIMQSEVMEDEPISSDSDKDVVDEDASEVIGKVEEIKDFMLIITDDDNVSYAFTFEEKPEGLDKIAVGDRVLVTYTGTLSEVDPFTGKFTVRELSSGCSDNSEVNSSDKKQSLRRLNPLRLFLYLIKSVKHNSFVSAFIKCNYNHSKNTNQ